MNKKIKIQLCRTEKKLALIYLKTKKLIKNNIHKINY